MSFAVSICSLSLSLSLHLSLSLSVTIRTCAHTRTHPSTNSPPSPPQGYQGSKDSDAALASSSWKGKGGSYTFAYAAELEGAKPGVLTLKCLDMGKELIVHAAVQGQEARANLRCTVADHVTAASLGTSCVCGRARGGARGRGGGREPVREGGGEEE